MHTLNNVWVQEGQILIDQIEKEVEAMSQEEFLEWSRTIKLSEIPIQLSMVILKKIIEGMRSD